MQRRATETPTTLTASSVPPDLALCSATKKGCGCEIPEKMNRYNNQGSYLDHSEQYYTRIHCAPGSPDGPDRRVRNVYQCKNTELVLLREFFAPCITPYTKCIDTGVEGKIAGGPTCVAALLSSAKSGGVGTYLSRATILIISVSCIMFWI